MLSSLIKLQKKIFAGAGMLKYFTTHKWDFRNEQNMSKEITPEEDQIFPIDIKYDNEQYTINNSYGMRQFIMKEKLEDLPKARKQLKV
jgi:hypothetical protein